MMCLDDLSLFGGGNMVTGSWTWVGLLVLTGFVEFVRYLASRYTAARAAEPSRR